MSVAQSCPTLWPRGLQPARLLCPWDSPGKNTGLDCQPLLQGRSHLYREQIGAGWQLSCFFWSPWASPHSIVAGLQEWVCVCVCVCVCARAIIFITYHTLSQVLEHHFCHTPVVETVTKIHSGSTYSGSRRGNLRHHLLMEEWRSSRKACGKEILWPFLGSTICHIPVLKRNWYS